MIMYHPNQLHINLQLQRAELIWGRYAAAYFSFEILIIMKKSARIL